MRSWFRRKAQGQRSRRPTRQPPRRNQTSKRHPPRQKSGKPETKPAPRSRGTRGGRSKKKPEAEPAAASDAKPAAEKRATKRAPVGAEEPKPARTTRRRTTTPKKSSLPEGREADARLDRRRRAAGRGPRGRQPGRGLPRAPRSPVDRRATSTRASSTTSCRGWRRRSSTSASRRTASSTSTRSSCPSSRASATGRRSRISSSGARRCSSRRSRIRWARRGRGSPPRSRCPAGSSSTCRFGDGIGVSRRLDDDERERLKAICKGLELPEGGIIVRTAAEGASEEELFGRPRVPAKALGDDPGPGGAGKGAVARLPRGGVAAAGRPRPLPARLRASRRRPRAHVSPNRLVPEANVSRARRQGRVVPRRRFADGDAPASMRQCVRRSIGAWISRRAATSCSTTPRPSR